jgi:hypothetical protein
MPSDPSIVKSTSFLDRILCWFGLHYWDQPGGTVSAVESVTIYLESIIMPSEDIPRRLDTPRFNVYTCQKCGRLESKRWSG